jgi:hypothetical protein
MGSRPVITATERYKMLLANALERVCVLEEQLEKALMRIEELEGERKVNELTDARSGSEAAPGNGAEKAQQR